MQTFYKHFPEIDNVQWTEYFLKDFMPKHNFFEKTSSVSSSYIEYHKKDFSSEPKILELSFLLIKKLKFPAIEYFIIFKHVDMYQPIHADGVKVLRNASFNLPLLGYEGTKTNFYKKKNSNVEPEIRNANYYNVEDVNLAEELAGKNKWALIDSSVPHNVVGIKTDTPRITLCIRFVGNPKFERLIQNAKS